MSALRAWVLAASVLAPGTVSPAMAVYDWTPRILEPSSWDWCGAECAGLPSLGVVRIERGTR